MNGYGTSVVNGRRLWVLGGTHFFTPALTNSRYLIDPSLASFADYLKVAAVYKCPADNSTFQAGAQAVPKIRSYAMNAYVGSWQNAYLTAGYREFKRMSDFGSVRPSALFLFQDVLPESLCFPAFVVRMSSPDRFFHFPSSQHLRRRVF